MSIDVIGLVKEAITPEAVNLLSNSLVESFSGTTRALEGAAAAILAGMAGKTSDGSGIASLLSLFSSSDAGEVIVQKILGEKAGPVADAISSQSGVRPASALSLLGVAAPLVVGAISRASGEGVTVASLLRILASQKESFARALPAGLGGILGGAPLAAVGALAESNLDAKETQPAGALRRFWPLWTLLAVVMVGGLIWSFTQDVAPVQTAVAINAGPNALGDFFHKKLPNGVELNIPQLGIENRLIDFIEGPDEVDKETWFDFDRLLFDTGSPTLQPSSQEQLDNIANILKAYPKVQVKIGGYTDNVGGAASNLALSKQRANNVMASLDKAGVEGSRITAEGYGEMHPVADNATEEGRAKNRRISLRVTAK